jgi:putative flippase GtrA
VRRSAALAGELRLAGKFAAVCVVGFLADAGALRLGLGLGLGATLARLISLALSLQITFGLSQWLVFHPTGQGTLFGHWWRYMVANTFGGLCNLWIFVALMGRERLGAAGPWAALVLSSGAAFLINYAGTRLFVYGRDLAAANGASRATPTPEP